MLRSSSNKIYNLYQKSLVLQHDHSDCGVACLLSIIKFYQGDNKIEKLRRLSGTTKQGTTLLGLYQTANALGFNSEGKTTDIINLKNIDNPVILHVTLNNRQHYVVCYNYINGQFIIGDPAEGIKLYNDDELKRIWKSKTLLVLQINKSFVKQKEEQKAKIKWLIQLVKKDKKLLLFITILALCVSILGMVMAVFSQKLVDDILPSKDLSKLITGIVLVSILLLAKLVFSSLRFYFVMNQKRDFNNRIVDRFYGTLLSLPQIFFDTRKIGELVSRLNDTERIQKVIQQITSNFIVNFLVTVVSIVFIFYYSFEIGVISTISLPFYFLIVYHFNSKIITTQKKVMQSKANSQSNYISSMSGITTVKNNNKQSVFKDLNKIVYGHYQNQVFDLGKINIKLSLLSGGFSLVFLITILSIASIKVFNNLLELGELMAILSISSSLLPSVASLALIAIPINEAKVAFNRMYDFVSIEKEKEGILNLDQINSIELNNLSYRFAGRASVLKNISLIITKGEFIAIVGESGSGKSTLGKIIQRLYSEEKGSILINNAYELKDIKLESWRSRIGIIEQEIKVFNGNVIDNITMGDDFDLQELEEFLVDYGFDSFITKFPQGYNTIIGEEGVNLSGGQKQIIALARALYKKPDFLILDEFTSAMDRKTEQFSFELLHRIKKNISLIFITHRLNTLPNFADKIYVLEEGEINTFGSHKQLLEDSNFYSDYWKNYRL